MEPGKSKVEEEGETGGVGGVWRNSFVQGTFVDIRRVMEKENARMRFFRVFF
jgi:hypothetical protein